MDLTLLVVQLTDSFADLWPDLARDLGVTLRVLDPGAGVTFAPDVMAVLVAAGGAEREAVEWLEGYELRRGPPVIVVGADPGRRIAARAVGRGARDYFAMPDDVELLRNALATAAARRRQEAERDHAAPTADVAEAFVDIIGESPALQTVLSRASRILPHTDATALLIGETGTGKELLARAIHTGGPRKGAPFVPVNCSTLPAHLIESELFGHERGAFTDAHTAKPGLFEVADGGTLFLDEIATLSPDLQAKLLRVLEDRVVRRVGGTRSRRVDVRIIAATNENLQEAIRAGQFRQDLFFRLSVVTLTLPPLRERGDDAVRVAEELIPRLARQHGLAVAPLGTEARRALRAYPWPGNVRELRNALERALLLSPAGRLDVGELIPAGDDALPGSLGAITFPGTLDEILASAVQATLTLCDGNRSEAARRLGISRGRLRRLLPDQPE